ncbi:MAG: universal stress protein [Syntrophobacteraceae bacterium]|jgi:nucleotide-binding universal stress UspA family protein
MFKNILIPSDLTERNLKAMDIAVKLAQEDSAAVTLLHVIETVEQVDSEDFDKFYRQLGARAGRKIDKLIAKYGREGITMEKQILYGRRVYEILNFAVAHGVDLIIMSSHKLDPENAAEGWGTISFKIGVLSHCPVMLVK